MFAGLLRPRGRVRARPSPARWPRPGRGTSAGPRSPPARRARSHSRTASTSSPAVGTSCGPSPVTPPARGTGRIRSRRRRRPMRRQFVAAGVRREVGVGLEDAHDRPLPGAEHLPPVHRRRGRSCTSAAVVGGDQFARTARPRRPAGPWPNRHALTHSQPRSSIGSPMWASSQSITAFRPSVSDDEVAEAEVAVHDGRGRCRRAVGRRASCGAEFERRMGLAERVEHVAVVRHLVGRDRASAAAPDRSREYVASARPSVAGEFRRRVGSSSSSRRILRAMVSPSTRLEDHERGAGGLGSVDAATTVGRRHTRRRRRHARRRPRSPCRAGRPPAAAAGSSAGRRPGIATSPATLPRQPRQICDVG